MSKGKGNLSGKEFSLILREHTNFDKMAEKLATLDEFHQEVDTELILENIFHVNQERMIDLSEDILFELDIFHLLIL